MLFLIVTPCLVVAVQPCMGWIPIKKKKPNKNSIFSCSHCSCSIFVLISYFLHTQVMLILISIDVQYSQKGVFSFEKGLYHQKTLLLWFLWPSKKSPPSKISNSGNYPPPHPLPLFGKPWTQMSLYNFIISRKKRGSNTGLFLWNLWKFQEQWWLLLKTCNIIMQ